MDPILNLPPDLKSATEILLGRSLTGKMFDRGGIKRSIFAGVAVAHVPDDFNAWALDNANLGHNFNWIDGDTDMRFVGGVWRPKMCWHDCEIDPSKIGYHYHSKRLGDVDVTLKKINGVALRDIVPAIRIVAEQEGNRVYFRDVKPGLDIYFEYRVGQVRTLDSQAYTGEPNIFLCLRRTSEVA